MRLLIGIHRHPDSGFERSTIGTLTFAEIDGVWHALSVCVGLMSGRVSQSLGPELAALSRRMDFWPVVPAEAEDERGVHPTCISFRACLLPALPFRSLASQRSWTGLWSYREQGWS